MHYVCDRYNAFVAPSIGLRVLLLMYAKWYLRMIMLFS